MHVDNMSKREYFALQIYCARNKRSDAVRMVEAVIDADSLLKKLNDIKVKKEYTV